MKSSILTIILTALVATTPLRAQQSFFDALFNAIQQNPKTTLLCALAGCAVSAKIAYNTAYNAAYESTLEEREIADFIKNKPMIMLFGEAITDKEKSFLRNFDFHDQGDGIIPQVLLMHMADNAHRQELINEPNMPDYQFINLEAGQPFPIAAQSRNLQHYHDRVTLNAMHNGKYNQGYLRGKEEGDQEGYERGRGESSSGKIKEKGKQFKQKLTDKI